MMLKRYSTEFGGQSIRSVHYDQITYPTSNCIPVRFLCFDYASLEGFNSFSNPSMKDVKYNECPWLFHQVCLACLPTTFVSGIGNLVHRLPCCVNAEMSIVLLIMFINCWKVFFFGGNRYTYILGISNTRTSQLLILVRPIFFLIHVHPHLELLSRGSAFIATRSSTSSVVIDLG